MKKHLYINGTWKETNYYEKLVAPYSGEQLADIAQASLEDVKEAVSAAKQATKTMAALSSYERSAILERVVEELSRRKEELTRIIALEAAKPLKAARGEVERTIQTYKVAAEEAKRITGTIVPIDAAPGAQNRTAYTLRKPIGVIAAITPFNFPMNLVAHKVGPAIASGNTVVLKPASQTPLSALVLAEIMETAGLPKGAFNIITGKGSLVGEALVKDERVAAITFTGSPEVGIAMKSKAGLKRVTLELGSNSAVIIDKHTKLSRDLIERCKWGAFVYNGQVCISVQRIFVHESLHEEFVQKLSTAVGSLHIGDPLDEQTDITALISKKEVIRMEHWIGEAVEKGARIIYGGKAINDRVFAPTILANVPTSCFVQCKEVFGPVVSVNSFSTIEEAIEEVNNSKYGLQAGIFTNDLSVAMKAVEELEVGGVMVNDVPTFRVDHMPYGGVKESGTGKEGIKYAIEEMTELKLVCFTL
ncbi:aldehyde dehydrogenase family protein [Bacillus sp. 165]|uniref:aldehyde dehydrogenase family protein n=1 Tax=Bacillus sp. 165 TaxID=1529117 RepID=UPI001ADA5927|nr:aldehyde dehydrogenase family protein [Bacillus sp. 165]MBO9129315.1 aldehyde dehydrogenase family protein [Bacillus sp. 165]